jgi:hypothetical protein
MDHATLETLRRSHPGWRLLAADQAPTVAAFLHAAFVAPNVRSAPGGELAGQLDDFLTPLRERLGEGAFPRSARQYLDTWADDDHGWLRKYYPQGAEEAWFDLTPAAEKAIEWLSSLQDRAFVGTESRLRTVFELLRQLTEGTEVDPAARIAELEKRRAAIDADLQRIRDGHVDLLDATQIRDRFQQLVATARGILSDFREVEQNFRTLDRKVRERIATWEGSKGALLSEMFGERDAIGDSDQGRSFRAFWDLLMSPDRLDELSTTLRKVIAFDAVAATGPDARLARIHYDWLDAGDTAQRTVARLSAQLRRYLDDQAWIENRRIMQLLRGIEHQALALRDQPPDGAVAEIADLAPSIELPMERPPFRPPYKARIADVAAAAGDEDVDADALYRQSQVDEAQLRERIRRALQSRAQVSLGDLLAEHPPEHGLAELVAYLAIAAADPRSTIDDARPETLTWDDPDRGPRRATLPLVVFTR